MLKSCFVAVSIVILTAPAFGAPSRADRCAASDTIDFTPAEMLQMEDDFRAGLGPDDRARLDQVLPRAPGGRIASCATRDGASCDEYAYVVAFKAAGLMERFAASICPVVN